MNKKERRTIASLLEKSKVETAAYVRPLSLYWISLLKAESMQNSA